jgi:hypothetical protein
MNRRSLASICSAVAAGSLFVAACSSTAATPAPTLGGLQTPGPTAAPSLAIPSIAIPSIAIPSVAIPSVSIPSIALPSGLPTAIPSFAIPSLAIPSGSFDIPSFEIPSFSFPSEDKDLEARLPNQINGVTLIKYSFKGGDFIESGGASSKDLIDLLTALGKTPNDMSVAFAGDPNGALNVQIGAFKVAGADSNALLAAFVTATKQQSPNDVVTQGNVGGKNVTQITDPADTESGSVYIYSNGDVLFYVASPDATLAGTALQALP